MTGSGRRGFVGGALLGAGALTAARAEERDGHAAGRDVAAADGMTYVPRRPGDAATFTASLDRAAMKATSGGWAREITTRHLPIATELAAAHLFLNPGGAREMHWHNSAEWGYVIGGSAQVTVVDAEGVGEVVNVGAGDLWYFPRGHAHAIQTIGSEPCHALLVFDDGLYGEHGTFGLTDWLSRTDSAMLARNLGVEQAAVERLPPGETYIMQGAVLAADGPETRAERPLSVERSHRFPLLSQPPRVTLPGGTIHVASSNEFAASKTMTGSLLRLAPGAMQELHWHPEANEMHYVVQGRLQISLFELSKHLGTAAIGAGDCAYVPRGCGHTMQNIGSEPAEVVTVLDSPHLQVCTLSAWMSYAPAHLLANNLRMDARDVPPFRNGGPLVEARG